jgi:hypothetical protein
MFGFLRRRQVDYTAPPPVPGAALDAARFEAEQHALVNEARARGAADAARHQDDLLDRRLPIDAEAATVADARRARLDALVEQELALAAVQIEQAQSERESLSVRLAVTRGALEAEGIDPDRPRTRVERRAVLGLAAGSACCIAVAAYSVSRSNSVLVIASLVAGLLFAGLALAVSAPPEGRAVASLQQTAEELLGELCATDASLAGLEALRGGIERRGLHLAAAEATLPAEMQRAYRAGVMSALLPGALADGAELGEPVVSARGGSE